MLEFGSSIILLQIGHDLFNASHWSMHSLWKWCLHGRYRIASFDSYSPKQMAQLASSFSISFSSKFLDLRALIWASVAPPGALSSPDTAIWSNKLQHVQQQNIVITMNSAVWINTSEKLNRNIDGAESLHSVDVKVQIIPNRNQINQKRSNTLVKT